MAESIVDRLGAAIPSLRRYARALTGSRETGDQYGATALEATLQSEDSISADESVKVALFRTFHLIWASAGAPVGDADSRLGSRVQERMATLTPNSREALLLHAIEGFDFPDIGRILMIDPDEARQYVDIARQEIRTSVLGTVMIIEDEPIIAMDLAAIIDDMGHRVTGIARTYTEAVELAGREVPDLILADIQLADKSSGIEAVQEIQNRFDAMPVIFISAFPERLLTGQMADPAFLISKPFNDEQVRSAVSQAMFFSSTETLLQKRAESRRRGAAGPESPSADPGVPVVS